jgi:dolichyl-phosphate beta-glucosyltransferase
VIMPVYNVGREVTHLIEQALDRYSLEFGSFELIAVDDGSTDGTFEALKSIEDERLKVVRYPLNQGKGSALIFGFGFSVADKVIFADGDMQALPRDYDLYIGALENADIAVSSKRVLGARVSAGVKRKFLSIGFNTLVKLLLPVSVSDTQAGFKAFRRNALQKILPLISVKKYAFDVEVLVVAKLLGLKIVELPINITLGSDFRSKHILRMMVDILGIAYRFRMKRWYHLNLALKERIAYDPILKW